MASYMVLDEHMNAQAVMEELGQRLAQLRLAKNLTQQELAQQAGIGLRTLQRLENGSAAAQLSSFIRVCRALGQMQLLDRLLPEATVSPLALLQREGEKPQRASRRKKDKPAAKPWEWGE